MVKQDDENFAYLLIGTSMLLIVPTIMLLLRKIKTIRNPKINYTYSIISVRILKINIAVLSLVFLFDGLIIAWMLKYNPHWDGQINKYKNKITSLFQHFAKTHDL